MTRHGQRNTDFNLTIIEVAHDTNKVHLIMAIRFYTTSENAHLLTKAAKKYRFFFRTLMRTDTDTLVHCETNAQGYQYIKDNGIDAELKELGIQEGDTVRMYGHFFEYFT